MILTLKCMNAKLMATAYNIKNPSQGWIQWSNTSVIFAKRACIYFIVRWPTIASVTYLNWPSHRRITPDINKYMTLQAMQKKRRCMTCTNKKLQGAISCTLPIARNMVKHLMKRIKRSSMISLEQKKINITKPCLNMPAVKKKKKTYIMNLRINIV